jgi:hypothetical protein
MVSRPIKMPEKDVSDTEPPPTSQRKRTDDGRYLLQIDRQTKGSYESHETAQKAGLAIKKNHPVVQVSVYDRIESTNTIVPTADPSS